MAKHDRYPVHRFPILLLFAALSALAQQPASAPPDNPPQETAQPSSPQPLDFQELVARDVLAPLQDGIQTHNLKQVLSVFDTQSFPDFPRLRDHLKAFLDANAVLQFRYKILQSSDENDQASVTCEIDLDATPQADGQVPQRRSTQIRLKLKQTAKGWQIAGLTPDDFFAQ